MTVFVMIKIDRSEDHLAGGVGVSSDLPAGELYPPRPIVEVDRCLL